MTCFRLVAFFSKATKRKHVIEEFNEFEYPEIHQVIAKIHGTRGNYLFEVETVEEAEKLAESGASLNKNNTTATNNESIIDASPLGMVKSSNVTNANLPLASMPTKFRETIWIMRGMYVYLEPIDDGSSNNKVKFEISRILNPKHIKKLYLEDLWPKVFTDAVDSKTIDNLMKECQINKFVNSHQIDLGKGDASAVNFKSNSKNDSQLEEEEDDNDHDEDSEEEESEEEEEFVNPNRRNNFCTGVDESDSSEYYEESESDE